MTSELKRSLDGESWDRLGGTVTVDATDPSIITDPNADPDNDDLSSLLEYALGTSPTTANPNPFKIAITGTSVEITTTINQEADDIEITLQSSSSLTGWNDANEDLPIVSRINNGDGTTTVTYRSQSGFLLTNDQQFFRIKVTLIP